MKLSQEESKAIAAKGYANPVFFNRFFLGHWFTEEIPWLHKGLLAILTRQCKFLLEECTEQELDKILRHFVYKSDPVDPNSEEIAIFFWKDSELCMRLGRFTVILIPRGYGKTTICNSVTLRKIYYQESKFPVYISETGAGQTGHAVMQLGNVKREIAGNGKLNAVFGNIKPDRRDGEKWTEAFIEAKNGAAIAAKGRGSQIRGMLHASSRPDFILMDDVEDKESVKTEDQRAKAKEWAFGDVKPALANSEEATIVAIGTLLHPDALLMTLYNDPQWTGLMFSVLDKDNEPTWPEHHTIESLEREKQSFALAGQLSSYYLEYFNQVRAGEDAKFREDYIVYEPVPAGVHVHWVVALDPAISSKPGADYASVCVAGMASNSLIYVAESMGGIGVKPAEQVDWLFQMADKYAPQTVGIESVAFQASLIHTCREEMFRRNKFFNLEPITHSRHDGSKEERVEGILQPRYSNGAIRHTRRHARLEAQLLDWPNGKRDYPDALAMAVSLLDPFAGQAFDPANDVMADAYKPLDKVVGDWRRI